MKQLGLNQPCNICWFVFLISFCVTGTSTQSVNLTQAPGFPIALITKEIEIKCEVKGTTTDNLRVCWYRETSKKEQLEFLVCTTFGPKESYTYGIFSQSRLDMKKNNFPISYTMKIKDLQHSDSGAYFCMVDMGQKLSFGNGTYLTVVETLPTTAPPTTQKPKCNCRKRKISKESPPGLSCSPVIWAPVAGFAVTLMIGLYFLASHTYRVYKRTHMYFRKYSPK
ncbi:T-cell surface glycoprotein CD8 beta chain-like [Rana temporaria]|uniref:T-cell surface glycoprotein CD8 beta chain-like n=1 Tax=Rana temporaria TaxID=8407 RepID=UPI001AADEE24|nr:T-cell surface glycoprotein CD8 beta chain-like [Rana temporaria]